MQNLGRRPPERPPRNAPRPPGAESSRDARSQPSASSGAARVRGSGALPIAALVLAIAAIEGPARAEERTPISPGSYVAPDGCPSEGEFRARIKAAIDRDRLDVRVEAIRSGLYRGRIVVDFEEGSVTERVIDAPSCEEVVTALALVANLAVDEHQESQRSSVPATTTTTVAPAIAPETTTTAARASETPPPSPPPAAAAVASRPTASAEPAEARTAAPPPPPRGFDLGASGGVTGAVGPGALPVAGGFVEYRFSRRGPSVRLGGGASLGSAEATSAVGRASFRSWGGLLDACPWALGLGTRFSATACARLEVGVLHAEGVGVSPVREEDVTWLAAGLPLRVRAWVARRVFLELEGTPRVPLRPHRFVLDPGETEVFRIPAVSWSAGVAVGASLFQ